MMLIIPLFYLSYAIGKLYRARVLVHSLQAESSRASKHLNLEIFELRQGDIESTKLSILKTF